MSRLADIDILGDSTNSNTTVAEAAQAIDDKTRTTTHERNQSITTPLQTLEIGGRLATGDMESQQLNDKEDVTMPTANLAETIKTESAVENVASQTLQPQDDAKLQSPVSDTLPKLPNIKEESLGPSSIREASPTGSQPTMARKGPPKKKAAPGGPRKPAAKKRKLENRADTPQSQGSGTPNSALGGKTAAKGRKQNSATPINSSPAPDEGDDGSESDNELYCICRKPDDHTWMIACDGGCDDWFHGRCVHIVERDSGLIDKFICPNCSESKGAETTWKLMCRLEGCREPAAISAPRPSKYCCDDHATEFFRRIIKQGLSTDNVTSAKKRRKENLTDNSQNQGDSFEKPLHLRGGVLSASELKTITLGMTSYKQFRALGNTVPVIEPVPKSENDMQVDSAQAQFSAQEAEQLETTINKTERLRHQLISIEDRERFLGLVKNRAKSASEEFKKKDKSMKDMCGFDARLRLSDEDFDVWRKSEEGIEAFKTSKLKPDQTDADGDASMNDGSEDIGRGMCLRKRCKQHEGWFKLHTQEFAYGKQDLQREMVRLAGIERGIRERATIRYLESQPSLNKMIDGA